MLSIRISVLAKTDIRMDNIKQLFGGNGSLPKQYVLVIDEINRGNISKILGELITLLEADKRVGTSGETWLTLPYSGDKFRVPSNLYILGTMNTADRSIALLDTALRRRFSFIEMMPEPDLLPYDIDGINLRQFLRVLNERVEYLYDRDHTIGHAYFMRPSLNLESLQEIMRTSIIPLLQEYFYEDWQRIELVLGGAGPEGDDTYFISKTALKVNMLFSDKISSQYNDRFLYRIVAKPSKEAFLRLYGPVASSGSENE